MTAPDPKALVERLRYLSGYCGKAAEKSLRQAADLIDSLTAPVDGEAVEQVARAICKTRVDNPDCLYQHNFEGDWPEDERREYADRFTGEPRVQLFHRAWRRWEGAARAAIAAMPADDELRRALQKTGWTRLDTDYIPAGCDVEEGWRIHDFPKNSQVAHCIAFELEEDEARAIVAVVNAALATGGDRGASAP